MKLVLALFAILLTVENTNGQSAAHPPVRFAVADVYIEPHDTQPLAAYQVDVNAENDGVKLVGIEAGGHPAFADPPYYDPAALQRQRVILAGFSTSPDLPTGRTRVARLHLQIDRDAELELTARSIVIANSEGQPIAADVTVVEGDLP